MLQRKADDKVSRLSSALCIIILIVVLITSKGLIESIADHFSLKFLNNQLYFKTQGYHHSFLPLTIAVNAHALVISTNTPE
jgi:hypothetical protein